MAEQWHIRWVDYYQVLQLRSEVESEVINAVYKKLAVKYHPDNKTTGDETMFKLLNEANEVLSKPEKRAVYDQEYALRHLPHSPQRQATHDDNQRRAATAQREQAEQQRREAEIRQQREAEERWRKQQLQIIYPVYRGTSVWSRVNKVANGLVNRLGLDDAGAGLLGFFVSLIAIMLPLALILRLLAFMLDVRVEEFAASRIYGIVILSWLGLCGACLWGNLLAVDSLDTIHAARRPRTVWISTSQVWPAIEQVLHAYRYHGHGWSVEEKTVDTDDATEKLIASCIFSYKLLGLVVIPYTLTMTMKVKETDSVVAAKVCYWFETQSPWYWLWPAATVVKQTNEALRKALPGTD